MTDITELAQRARINAECGEHLSPAETLELVEALEKAQRANAAQDDHINQQQDRIEWLEKGNQYAGKRIADLESRTVKLPEPEQWDITQVLLCKKKVVAAIRAAGIKVEAE